MHTEVCQGPLQTPNKSMQRAALRAAADTERQAAAPRPRPGLRVLCFSTPGHEEGEMTKNMGTADRLIRTLVAISIGVL